MTENKWFHNEAEPLDWRDDTTYSMEDKLMSECGTGHETELVSYCAQCGKSFPIQPEFDYDPDYMCPNCVTPWKCNGPHIPQGDKNTYVLVRENTGGVLPDGEARMRLTDAENAAGGLDFPDYGEEDPYAGRRRK